MHPFSTLNIIFMFSKSSVQCSLFIHAYLSTRGVHVPVALLHLALEEVVCFGVAFAVAGPAGLALEDRAPLCNAPFALRSASCKRLVVTEFD